MITDNDIEALEQSRVDVMTWSLDPSAQCRFNAFASLAYRLVPELIAEIRRLQRSDEREEKALEAYIAQAMKYRLDREYTDEELLSMKLEEDDEIVDKATRKMRGNIIDRLKRRMQESRGSNETPGDKKGGSK